MEISISVKPLNIVEKLTFMQDLMEDWTKMKSDHDVQSEKAN